MRCLPRSPPVNAGKDIGIDGSRNISTPRKLINSFLEWVQIVNEIGIGILPTFRNNASFLLTYIDLRQNFHNRWLAVPFIYSTLRILECFVHAGSISTHLFLKERVKLRGRFSSILWVNDIPGYKFGKTFWEARLSFKGDGSDRLKFISKRLKRFTIKIPKYLFLDMVARLVDNRCNIVCNAGSCHFGIDFIDPLDFLSIRPKPSHSELKPKILRKFVYYL